MENRPPILQEAGTALGDHAFTAAITALIGSTIALLASVTRKPLPMTRCWRGLTVSFWPCVTAWIASAPRTAKAMLTDWNASRLISARCVT